MGQLFTEFKYQQMLVSSKVDYFPTHQFLAYTCQQKSLEQNVVTSQYLIVVPTNYFTDRYLCTPVSILSTVHSDRCCVVNQSVTKVTSVGGEGCVECARLDYIGIWDRCVQGSTIWKYKLQICL